ncbi:hypothetical protein [Amycolatopsis anabasis]|uniref:hypothetical protein n=1 Tax=Amycolatopsis anabasis TaxID=1840409 RepID=UPI00131E7969|nr:hypothetical protein [Amycolatopsis anabasis]
MRRIGAWLPRHRSLLTAALLALLLFTLATPTNPFHHPRHGYGGGIEALAQQPLPHCAPAAPLPVADLPPAGSAPPEFRSFGVVRDPALRPVLSRAPRSTGARSPPPARAR